MVVKSDADGLQGFREELKGLTNDRLDFIYRFIRLWKKTSWSIPDLDLVLKALISIPKRGISILLSKQEVLSLARLVDVQEQLNLSAEELFALIDQLPVSRNFPRPPDAQSEKMLFERLKMFGRSANPFIEFYHYSHDQTLTPDQPIHIDEKTPLLLGVLGISETELLLLFDLLKKKCHLIMMASSSCLISARFQFSTVILVSLRL